MSDNLQRLQAAMLASLLDDERKIQELERLIAQDAGNIEWLEAFGD